MKTMQSVIKSPSPVRHRPHSSPVWSVLGAACLFAGVTLTSCGAFDAAVDCNSICSRYADCYNANYDVGACNSRCQNNASNSTSFSDNAGECNACINGRACTTATADCSSQCGSIVP